MPSGLVNSPQSASDALMASIVRASLSSIRNSLDQITDMAVTTIGGNQKQDEYPES